MSANARARKKAGKKEMARLRCLADKVRTRPLFLLAAMQTDSPPAWTFKVQGVAEEHAVRFTATGMHCDCRAAGAHRTCSHVLFVLSRVARQDIRRLRDGCPSKRAFEIFPGLDEALSTVFMASVKL